VNQRTSGNCFVLHFNISCCGQNERQFWLPADLRDRSPEEHEYGLSWQDLQLPKGLIIAVYAAFAIMVWPFSLHTTPANEAQAPGPDRVYYMPPPPPCKVFGTGCAPTTVTDSQIVFSCAPHLVTKLWQQRRFSMFMLSAHSHFCSTIASILRWH
jgi:hypothetical protein